MITPPISVIIPVYNGEHYLGEAIASVLAQTVQPAEVIVVDDGSTDASLAVAMRFAPTVRIITQANQGASAARNRGIALSSGEFLAFLDADDLWVADKLQQQMLALANKPKIAMVFGQVEQFYSSEVAEQARLPDLGDRQRLAGVHVGAMLIRRRAFAYVGPFDTQWQVAHFIEWHQRAAALGLQSLVLPSVVMRRRIHTDNLGIRAYTVARREYIRLAKAKLTQQRATAG